MGCCRARGRAGSARQSLPKPPHEGWHRAGEARSKALIYGQFGPLARVLLEGGCGLFCNRIYEQGMESALFVGLSQQMALADQMDVIANNIANASTPGFKGERMLFREYLMTDTDGQPVSYVEEAGLDTDYAEGGIAATGNPMDFAIRGEGFFAVATADGVRYTRAGHFELDADRRIVTGDGDPVLGENGQPLTLAAGDALLEVAHDGTISAESGAIGKFQIATFSSLDALTKSPGGLFESAEDPVPATSAEVHQGVIEESNVEPILEITRMLELVRAYQSAQRSNDTGHDLQRETIQTLLGTQQTA